MGCAWVGPEQGHDGVGEGKEEGDEAEYWVRSTQGNWFETTLFNGNKEEAHE